MSIRSHFTRMQWSRSQYFTSTNSTSRVFLSQLLVQKVCCKKPPYSSDLLIGPTAVTSHAAVSDTRSIQISSQNIFDYAAKQAAAVQ